MPLRPGPAAARSAHPARLALLLLAALVLVAAPASAQDEGPAASWLSKIAWSNGPGLTRVRFHAGWGLQPEVARTGPTRLRLDLRGVGAGETPASLRVGSPELVSIQRIPESARAYLPPGVSERFLVVLARADLAWNVEATDDGFQLLVGDEQLTGRPAPRASASSPTLGGLLDVRDGPRDEPPRPGEALEPPIPFRIGADLARRAGPSAMQPELGRLSEGEVKVADARRGGWLHLQDGGWIRHALGALAGRGTDLRERRTPAAWSVVTIVPVLNIQVEEVLPGRNPDADVVASFFRDRVRLARLTVLATGQSAFSFRFPPRADRLRLKTKDGRNVGSLDPLALPRREGVTLERLEEAFPAPQISTGQGFSGWLVLPEGLDFLAVDEARIDVAGRIHLLFRVPGSGEMVEQ